MSKKNFYIIIVILIIVFITITSLILTKTNEQNNKPKEMQTTSNSEQNLYSNEKMDNDENEDYTFEIGSYFYELPVDEETIYFVGYTFNEDGTVVGMLCG